MFLFKTMLMRHFFAGAVTALCALASFTACGQKASGQQADELAADSQNVERLAFENVTVDTAVTVMNGADMLKATVHIQMMVAKGPGAEAVNDSLFASELFIPEFLPKASNGMTPQQRLRAFAKAFLDGYQTECADLKKEGLLSSAFNYSYDLTSKVEDNEADSLACYEASAYVYMAGAHGSSMTVARNFNVFTGAMMGKAQLLKDGGEKAVAKLICQQLQKQMEVKSMEELKDMGVFFGEEPYVPRNFVVKPDSITFIYMQDEAAPHALGEMLVTLGKGDLSKYLK